MEDQPTWKKFVKKAAIPAALGIASVVAAPLVLSAAGFGAGGIVAGSLAAKMMSLAALANGGGVVAGGIVATLQSAGAVGIATSSLATIAGVTAAGTAVVQEVAERYKHLDTETGSDELDEEEEKGSDEVMEGKQELVQYA